MTKKLIEITPSAITFDFASLVKVESVFFMNFISSSEKENILYFAKFKDTKL